MVKNIETISAEAAIPDQLASYVKAVSGMKPHLCEDCLLYRMDEYGVLVAWKNGSPLDQSDLDKAVETAVKNPGLKHLTVLAATRPSMAPENASVYADEWWRLDLLRSHENPKLANMLRRAKRELTVKNGAGSGCFDERHKRLTELFCANRKEALGASSCHIYRNLDQYLAECNDARLFSAFDGKGGLQGFAIGDFSGFSTAFYMFAVRNPDSPPGTADLLLAAIVDEAEKLGMSWLNLGLEINPGIGFFKRKWGAEPFYPHVECGWQLPSRSFLARLFGR